MHPAVPKTVVFIFFFLYPLALAAGPTSIYINQVPEYALLSTCAELQVSTIVRNMDFGCGDGSKLTSFACFCYESSAKFSSMIGKHVQTACTQDPAQNTSAVEVFNSYCQLGKVAAAPNEASTTPSSSSSSSSTPSPFASASPASVVETIRVTSSPTASPPPESSPKRKTPVVAIAVGVTAPVVLIAIGILGFMLLRRPRRSSPAPSELAGENMIVEARSNSSELSREQKEPLEMDNNVMRMELASPVHELSSGEKQMGA